MIQIWVLPTEISLLIGQKSHFYVLNNYFVFFSFIPYYVRNLFGMQLPKSYLKCILYFFWSYLAIFDIFIVEFVSQQKVKLLNSLQIDYKWPIVKAILNGKIYYTLASFAIPQKPNEILTRICLNSLYFSHFCSNLTNCNAAFVFIVEKIFGYYLKDIENSLCFCGHFVTK